MLIWWKNEGKNGVFVLFLGGENESFLLFKILSNQYENREVLEKYAEKFGGMKKK